MFDGNYKEIFHAHSKRFDYGKIETDINIQEMRFNEERHSKI